MAELHGTRPVSPTSEREDTRRTARRSDENWLVDQVRQRATAGLESQKQRATEGLGRVAQAVRGTGDQLRGQEHSSFAEYVDKAAEQIERVSRRIEEKEVGELVDDVRRAARRHTAAVAGSAFVLGLLTARFLKSSADNEDRDWWDEDERRRYETPSYGAEPMTRTGEYSGRTAPGAGVPATDPSEGFSGIGGAGTTGIGSETTTTPEPASTPGTSSTRRPGSRTERS